MTRDRLSSDKTRDFLNLFEKEEKLYLFSFKHQLRGSTLISAFQFE
jgi:hypothetical protein